MKFSSLLDFNPVIFGVKRYCLLKIILYVLLYKFSLDYIYCYIISPLFAYAAMTLDIIAYKYIISSIAVIVFSLFFRYFVQDFRPSSIVLVAFYILFFIPNCSIYGLAGLSDSFFCFTLLYFFLLSIVLLICNKSNWNFTIRSTKRSIFAISTSLILLLFVSLLLYYNGFHIKIDMKDIYDIRLDVREMDISPIYGYLKSFASKMVLILLMFTLIKKKYIYAAVLFLIQLMVYSFGALKSDLFALLIALGVYFIYSDKYRLWILKGLIVLNCFAILEYIYLNTLLISAVFQRRVLFIPPRLSYFYYDFFSNNELLYLRDSFLRLFGFSSPYPEKASYFLGYLISNNPDNNANTGICGDDFSQFGWYSVVLYPLLMTIVLKLYDVVAKGIDGRITLLISVLFAMSFISGTFFMILVTNGFILLLFYLYIMPKATTGEKPHVVRSASCKL